MRWEETNKELGCTISLFTSDKSETLQEELERFNSVVDKTKKEKREF